MPLAGSWPRGFALTRFNHDHDDDDDDHDHDHDHEDDHDDHDKINVEGVWRQPPTRKGTRFNC